MNPLLLWLTTVVFGTALGLGAAVFGLLILLGALPVVALVMASRTKRVGLSGLLFGFGAIWLLMIARVRAQCSAGEAYGCYSATEDAWVAIAAGAVAAALVLLVWALASRRRRVGPGKTEALGPPPANG
jgi:zinc transporter ZupT